MRKMLRECDEANSTRFAKATKHTLSLVSNQSQCLIVFTTRLVEEEILHTVIKIHLVILFRYYP